MSSRTTRDYEMMELGECEIVRRRVVLIPPEFLHRLMMQGDGIGEYECVEGLPEGAVFIRGYYDGWRNMFGLVFEHEDWDLVEEGTRLPIFTPIYRREFRK